LERSDRWLYAGLFLTTLATLLIELLDSRLLSVLTWYHLSFIAISLAMLGGASGAVLVFLAGERLSGERARRAIVPLAVALAIVIPLTHLFLIRMQIPPIDEGRAFDVGPLTLAVVLLTLPFLLSGALVTIGLTRCGGRIGILYGSDLLGAALGCLLIVPLLDRIDLLSTTLLAGGMVGLAAYCYARFAERSGGRLAAGLSVALVLAAALHVAAGSPLGVQYPRGSYVDARTIDRAYSNAHSHVTVAQPRLAPPFFWAKGNVPTPVRLKASWLKIDGGAGTALTEWNGEREDLEWVGSGLTALPYWLRSGNVAIVGVGGGRDILSALWSGSQSIVGVEINDIFVRMLERDYRDFAKIATQPEVRLVHDEARAWLTRTDETFDVLQMSLVDTWAATGAGAFTLTENALYTREAWQVFLSRLSPGGIFSTSRWFAPSNVSETSRLLALCVDALLAFDVDEPSRHIALVAKGRVANLMVSNDPFPKGDIEIILEVAKRQGFEVLALPGAPPEDPRLASILASRDLAGLNAAVADPHYDYRPPTDARPYFFNMLKPGSFHLFTSLENADVFVGKGGVIWGNVRATHTLLMLLLIASGLTLAIIGLPLIVSGLPSMTGGTFGLSLAYFALIGYGFMSIQIPLLQRFSVYLGHPIYTYSVTLFTMILMAGLGSLLSDRLERADTWARIIPGAVAMTTLTLSLVLPGLLDSSIGFPLAGRIAIVVATAAPLSLLLGFCFPLGMRLVDSISASAMPWMWGVNGASGVLASIVAVAVSMWAGIHMNFAVATTCYLLLIAVASALARRSTQALESGVS
jgi:SAM-dependent methyltransferase